jgi:uncharacterized integral membrane protein
MSFKLVAALVIIGLLVLILIFNSGTVTINLLHLTEVRTPKALLMFITFSTGLLTGILIKGK